MSEHVTEPVRPGEDGWPDFEKRLFDAMMLSNKGEWDETIDAARSMVIDYPLNAEPHMVLGIVAMSLGDEGQAIDFLKKAHELDPDTRDYVNLLAMMSSRVGRLHDSVYYAKISGICEPHPYLSELLPDEYVNLDRAFLTIRPSHHALQGQRHLNLGQVHQAIKEFSAEIRINPSNLDAIRFLARATYLAGAYTQAVGAAQSVLNLDPGNAEVRGILAQSLAHLGREGEAIAMADTAIAMCDGDVEVYVAAMDALSSCPSLTNDQLKARADAFAAVLKAIQDEDPYRSDGDDAELRGEGADRLEREGHEVHIGAVSNVFHRSEVSDYVSVWFSGRAARDTVMTGLQFSVLRDAVTPQFQGACRSWREIYDVDPFTLKTILEREGMDCLLDLSLPNRATCATILAEATSIPMRVGTTLLMEPGLVPGVTHILSDETLQVGDREMLLPGQSLIVVPGTLFAREPFKALPQDTSSPILENGYPTFGIVADIPDVSPAFALTVGRLLHEVPDAHLLILSSAESNRQATQAMKEMFMNTGALGRITFVEPDNDEEGVEGAMRRAEAEVPTAFWSDIDILLDTHPFNGRRALSEALWSGVPVITQQGPRRASSVGASILAGARRPNWVASGADEFVAKAVDLVADPKALDEERRELQQIIAGTSLFDPVRLGRNVRDAISEACRTRKSVAQGA